MLVPPKPWLGHNSGGYLYSPSTRIHTLTLHPVLLTALFAVSVVRLKESNEQLSYLKEADSAGAIEFIYACLDVLGRTPWIINRDVLEVAIAAWNSGKEYPRMPPLLLEQDIPEPPSDMSDMAEKVRFQNRLKALVQQKQSNHSDRCSVNYKMEVARSVSSCAFFLSELDIDGIVVPGRTLLPAPQRGLPRARLSDPTTP
jgi:DNA-directed RNA polymerase